MTRFAPHICRDMAGIKTRTMRNIINLPRTSLIAGIFICLCELSNVAIVHAAKPAQPRVVVTQAQLGTIINELRLSGTVSSPRVARLSTEVSGLIKDIHVDEGSAIKAGEILISLDTELENLSLQAARATTQRARAELDDARRRLADGKQLAKQKTVSANELKSLQAEVNIASATLQRYSAEEQLQQSRLQRHQLSAPFDGIISKRFIESGEWIKPGDAVMELVANENLRIDFQIPQKDFPRINATSEILIHLDAIPNRTLKGKIQTIVPYSDTDTRTFLLRVLLTDSNPAIAPGMSARGLLRLKTSTTGIVISRDAILRYPDGRITVWVVNTVNGRHEVSEKSVTTGTSFNDRIAILDGLKEGERVVVKGNESLRDGQTVMLQTQ
ncbi:MAG: efflux RND transporter periplasmic adaptor subunit [Gammaproteobacteria bacterium]|nr:efflux RND transporter periplasmic adaptor subunit [Gammaproteobacteria bacterium]